MGILRIKKPRQREADVAFFILLAEKSYFLMIT